MTCFNEECTCVPEVLPDGHAVPSEIDPECPVHGTPEPPRDAWDEEYERLAARDRADGFERTNGRDWT